MIKACKTSKIMGLLASTTLMSLSSIAFTTSVNATPYQHTVASYSNSVEYNPSAKYYVPGRLSYTHSRINVRTGPGKKYYARHYGLKGDRVTLLNQAWGHDGYQWWYLQFNESGAKGWVREDLVNRH